MSIALISGCQQSNEKVTVDEQPVKAAEKNKTEQQFYTLNEEAYITDQNDDKVYSIAINNAKMIDIPEGYKEDFDEDVKKLLVLDYTFKYIKEHEDLDGGIYITPWDFQVYDENGLSTDFVGLYSSDYPFDSNLLQEDGINAGRSKSLYGAYPLKNEVENIEIDFNSSVFSKKILFKIPVSR
jgi:hypothetical protein